MKQKRKRDSNSSFVDCLIEGLTRRANMLHAWTTEGNVSSSFNRVINFSDNDVNISPPLSRAL